MSECLSTIWLVINIIQRTMFVGAKFLQITDIPERLNLNVLINANFKYIVKM